MKFRRESNDGDEVDLGIAIAHAVNAVDIARQMSALAHAVARLYEWNEDAHTAAEEDLAAYAKAVLEHWQEFDSQRDTGRTTG